MKVKKRVIILVSFCLVILVGAIILDIIMGKSYFNLISYDDLIEKINNKEDIVLLISKTNCEHCIHYKPKLKDVANEYRVNVYYIDTDKISKDKANELGKIINYSGTPVTVFLKNGEETTSANRINGDASREKIVKKLKSNGFIG